MQKFFCICLFTIVTLFAAGCNNVSDEKKVLQIENTDAPSIEKNIITLCGDKSDTILMKMVNEFNSSNELYQVEIKNYDYERLLVEIMSGTGPDLFPVTIGLEECVKKGLVEDLTIYLENSNNLSQEDLCKKVLDIYTYDECLVTIPPAFSVSMLFGRKSDLGAEAGWTAEEFLNYVEQNRGATILDGALRGTNAENIMVLMWSAYKDTWIDWDNLEAHFNEKDFEELLFLAKSYEGAQVGRLENLEIRLAEGSLLLYNRSINNMRDYLYYKKIFRDDLVLIGYPTESGEPSYQMQGKFIYSINSKSENKNGAWEFLEYMITNWNHIDSGIPTMNHLQDKMFAASMEEKSVSVNGYDIPATTQEDVDIFAKMIECITESSDNNQVLYNIYCEEIAVCLMDGRSITDTAQILQNRCQLYLEELK